MIPAVAGTYGGGPAPPVFPFTLAAGEWGRVPQTGNYRLSDVYATPSPGGAQSAIMGSWGGACIDTSRLDLIVWGGGHTDYPGNEVYAFNLVTMQWRRKSYYSTPANNDAEENADGSAAVRHTYASLGYHAGLDEMICGPGGFLAGTGGVRARWTWGFDCANETPNAAAPSAWIRHDDILGSIDPLPNFAQDGSGVFWSIVNSSLATFDPALSPASQWVRLNTFDSQTINQNKSVVVPGSPDQLFWHNWNGSGTNIHGRSLGGSPWTYIGSSASTGIPATGATACISDATGSPGFDYDPTLGKILIWSGTVTGGTDNRDVYSFNTSTYVITKVSGTGDTPDNPNSNGTFGRWVNLSGCGPDYAGLWLLVNTTTSDCYFYRSV